MKPYYVEWMEGRPVRASVLVNYSYCGMHQIVTKVGALPTIINFIIFKKFLTLCSIRKLNVKRNAVETVNLFCNKLEMTYRIVRTEKGFFQFKSRMKIKIQQDTLHNLIRHQSDKPIK